FYLLTTSLSKDVSTKPEPILGETDPEKRIEQQEIHDIWQSQELSNTWKNSNNQLQILSLCGACFYILNLAKLQTFYVPFEAFTAHFGFLPWLLYSAIRYINSPVPSVIPDPIGNQEMIIKNKQDLMPSSAGVTKEKLTSSLQWLARKLVSAC